MTEFITSFPNELVCVNFTVVDDELFEGLLEVVGITIKSANTSIGNFSETFLLYIGDNDESESHNTVQTKQLTLGVWAATGYGAYWFNSGS